jgi:hypothetical protein
VTSLSTTDKALCGLYGGCAVVALVATWWFNIAFFSQENSGGLPGMIKAGYANYASTSFTNDLFVVFVVAAVFMIVEARRIELPRVWIYVGLSFVLAISVGFPLFLAARQVRLAERRATENP